MELYADSDQWAGSNISVQINTWGLEGWESDLSRRLGDPKVYHLAWPEPGFYHTCIHHTIHHANTKPSIHHCVIYTCQISPPFLHNGMITKQDTFIIIGWMYWEVLSVLCHIGLSLYTGCRAHLNQQHHTVIRPLRIAIVNHHQPNLSKHSIPLRNCLLCI